MPKPPVAPSSSLVCNPKAVVAKKRAPTIADDRHAMDVSDGDPVIAAPYECPPSLLTQASSISTQAHTISGSS